MLRIRLFAALVGAVLAGLAVATIAAADDEGGSRASSAAFGVGTFGPGCWQTGGGPFCTPFNYTIRLLGVKTGYGQRAWGEFQRRNNVTGGGFTATVTCMNIVGNEASVGGYLDTTGQFPGDPFVIHVEDNGVLGSSTPDQVSALAAFPPDDPGWALLPAGFPRVCPPAESTLGYLPLTSGDVTVTEAAVGLGGNDD